MVFSKNTAFLELSSNLRQMVEVYTDGAAKGNPGPGGYGIILRFGKHEKEISDGFRLTTNNRMELMAVCVALEALTKNGLEVRVHSDSKYVIDAVQKGWVFGWEKTGFKKKKNPDLWMRFLRSYRLHKVTFQWVKGHDGHEENERCDLLAVRAASGKHLHIDAAYEAGEADLFND
jgi:ribonuclease HI